MRFYFKFDENETQHRQITKLTAVNVWFSTTSQKRFLLKIRNKTADLKAISFIMIRVEQRSTAITPKTNDKNLFREMTPTNVSHYNSKYLQLSNQSQPKQEKSGTEQRFHGRSSRISKTLSQFES